MPRRSRAGAPEAGPVVARRAGRRAGRSGALWGLVFGAYVASSALGYAATYPTPAARAKLATSFGTNPGLAALLGPAHHLDTVAGFTGWRASGVLTVVGAVWGLFLATRLLRGEEDAGRWELILSGPTTRRAAALQTMVGLAAGLSALWAVTAVVTTAAGTSAKVSFSVAGSLYFATCLVAGAAIWLAVGALLSEVAANRHQANALGGASVGLAFVTRMIADSTSGGRWLRWASPIGWVEQLRPLAGPTPLAFLPVVGLTVAASLGAVSIAARRDLGASVMPSRDTPPPHTGLLGRPLGLAIRQVRSSFVGWAVAMAVFGLVIGLVAKAGASALTTSASIQHAIARVGIHGNGIKEFVGLTLFEAAALVAFAAASQVGALRAEEASSRLDHLLVAPVSRDTWLASRLVAAAGLIAGISLLGGVATWAGIALQGGGASLGQMVEAGVNLIPAAVFVLGAGTLVYGVKPRWAPVAAYLVIGWSFLIQFVATVIKTNRLLLDTSVLAHIAPVPAARANWAGAGWLVLLGVVAAGAGAMAFSRRDLAGE